MARVFISGSSTGLGLMTAQLLAEQGHAVVLHGRNKARSAEAERALTKAEAVVTGDLSTIQGMRSVAAQANRLGRLDAVIHNAGIGYRQPKRVETEDGLPEVFATNVLAPYVLTALIEPPARLVYLSSGMHHKADANLDDIGWTRRRWSGATAYAESKLHDVLLAFAAARRWPGVLSNALEPGWVPTRMGGPRRSRRHGPSPPHPSLAGSHHDPAAEVTGQYFHHLRRRAPNPQAPNTVLQDRLVAECERCSSVRWPD